MHNSGKETLTVFTNYLKVTVKQIFSANISHSWILPPGRIHHWRMLTSWWCRLPNTNSQKRTSMITILTNFIIT